MNLQELLNQLEFIPKTNLSQQALAYEIAGVYLYTPHMHIQVHGERFIYFIEERNMAKVDSACSKHHIWFVLTEHASAHAHATQLQSCSVADRTRWIDAYTCFVSEFQRIAAKHEMLLALTAAINNGASLERIANDAAEILEGPVSILDTSLAFRARSKSFLAMFAGQKDAEEQMIPENALPLMRARGFVNPWKPTELAIFSWTGEDQNHYTNHYASVFNHDVLVGSVSYFTKNEAARPSRVALIPVIAQLVSIAMQRQNSHTLNKGLYYTHLFQQLEDKTISIEPDEIARRLVFYGYQLKRHLHVVGVDMRANWLPAERLRPLAEQLQSYIPHSLYVIRDDAILFLTSHDTWYEESAADQPGLAELAQRMGLRLGISASFTDIRELPVKIRELRRAIEIGLQREPQLLVWPYSRFRVADFVSRMSTSVDAEFFLYPPLMRLIIHDETHGTQLTQTLACYLDAHQQVDTAADQLFIHKNTLYYRLAQIKEIMQVNLGDGKVICQIIIGLELTCQQGRITLTYREKASTSQAPAASVAAQSKTQN
ncbi:helix-turn-helix domain-containing protein [Collinsella sp. zg1085]|uniref:PucR family transcriptional regulator n=1 Tax=Collinsella sp. zg1085 TaxID=2844380 RepID=UPI001C0D137E|nr:helix-turn-helix domain-containing protein [Collinsella sp. zg1085]QWT17185.1 helix-turn-helix domain-containing protein [Collinsella sp. zg1085]